MYWFGFRNKKSRSKKVQQNRHANRYKSNVVVQALTDWMVARGSVKDSK